MKPSQENFSHWATSMKPNLFVLLKTLHLSLQNGKSLTGALTLLQSIAKEPQEKRIYSDIIQDIQSGVMFSKAIENHLSPSPDITQFIAMAEKGGSFVKTLSSVVYYMEIKSKFHQESNDKIAIPVIYFSLTAIIVVLIRFFAIPFHLKEAESYTSEIKFVIADHLKMAQNLSDILFVALVVLAVYFFTVMAATFNYSGVFRKITKRVAASLPMSSKIIEYFEKFILLSLLGEMLRNGVSLKTTLNAAASSDAVPKTAQQFTTTLERLKKGEKNFWDIPFFEEIEQHLIAGAGNTKQLGDMLMQFSDKARLNALVAATKFFRTITILAICLLAFAVFVEFFTVVLTQILIQQEFINNIESA